MTVHPDYPLPDTDDPVMKPFWDGCREHKLMIQREKDSGVVHWPPSPRTEGQQAEWSDQRPRQDLHYVVAYEPFPPAFQQLPHPVLVRLDNPRLVGYMIDCTRADALRGCRSRSNG